MFKRHPLNQSQLGIYLTCTNSTDEGNYNLGMLYRLDDAVDTGRLLEALDGVIAAHPYVKSRLVEGEGGEILFEERTDEEFHTTLVEAASYDEVRASAGGEYDLLCDRLFRLVVFTTPSEGNWLYADFHHIIFDGMSWSVFREDLAKAYAGEILQAEKIDGFRIAEDEAALRSGDFYAEAKDWYAKEFGWACELDSMLLPDLYGGNENRYTKLWKKLDIDTAALSSLCEREGVKESAVYDAAFAYTLSRFVAEDEVLYTSAYHGRADKASRRSFCMMVKTLPVCHNLRLTPTVGGLLRQSRDQALASRKYSLYSFADAHSDLGLGTDVSFVYQGPLHDLGIVLDGRRQQEESLVTHTPGFKFLGMLMVEDGAPYIWSEYQTDRFSATMIEEFWESYACVVNEMCIKENLCDIEICTSAQIAGLDSFNAHYKPYSSGETVLGALRAAAAQYPDNVAVIYKDRKLTYAELDRLSDRAGAWIYSKVRDCGKSEPVVSILIGRSEWMSILPLAAMKAGCAYQPLDPSYPKERLDFMVKDADAALLVTEDDFDEILSWEGSELPPADTLKPESLFILLYTSGSTGTPKGVMLEHRNLLSFIRWFREYYSLLPESRVAAYASFGFDADMMDQYPALTCGAALVIVPEEIRLDLVALEEYFTSNGVTHSFLTTQVGVQYVQNFPVSATLRHLSTGGEKLVSLDPPQNYAFHNAYGPTECTIFTTTFPVLQNEANIPIGKPIRSSLCYVCDRNMKRLPVGAAGELIIAGEQVGRGYLGRPDKTAEAFFTIQGKRAYHSGDIVRYRADGNIEFVGRRDGQVKIRGFRIELKEVEAVIREFPGVSDCTVQAFEDDNGGKFIAAYVVPTGKDFDVEALNAFILESKPPYMVPARTMILDSIPLNVNQKVDRKALPKPSVSPAPAGRGAASAPLNTLEKQLSEIISGIVKTDDFAITDLLGNLGLTSISGIRLSVQIYKKYGVQLDSRSLAKTATLQSIENEILSRMLSRREEEAGVPSEEASLPSAAATPPAAKEAPLSFTQQGVYTECLTNPDSVIYNMPLCLTFPAGVEAKAVREAVLQTLAAHPYMACRFVEGAGSIVQKPIEGFKPEVPVLEMTEEEFASRKKTFVRAFNLSQGPLFRFEIVLVAGKKCCLLEDIHHLVGDGASIDLLNHQICAAIGGIAPEKETYDYYDFVRDQKEDSSADEYFEELLGGVEEVSRLAPDVFTDEEHSLKSVSVKFHAQNLAPFIKEKGVTPAAYFLAATALTASRYLCEEEVSLATISNGRGNLLVSGTVGMFVNTLPLALRADISADTARYLSEVDSALDAALSHENYPFPRIASKYGFTPGISYACQIGVLEELSVPEGPVGMESLELDIAKIPLALYVNGSLDSEIELSVEYDCALYSESFVRHFASSIRNVALAMPSAASLAAISLTDASDCELLSSFNGELFTGFDRCDTAISLFRKQVEAHPDKEAAVYGDKRFTYRELDEQTDRLASIIYERMSRITGKTDLSEEVVSIIIDRNEWVFLLPLAVLKSGCAYEPLDPSYPAARLNYMVQDAGAKLLIGQKELVGLVSEYKGEVLLTSDFVQYARHSRVYEPGPTDLMLMLYTSGSTGKPKGVQIEHGNIVAFVSGVNASGFNGPDSRVAAYASFGFDVCMMDTFCTLLNGGTLYVIPEDMRLELSRLRDYMDAEGITQIFMTTQVGVQFLQNYPRMKTLRYLSMGGEKLPSVHPEGLSYKILNGYGPTENTCGASQFQIDRWEANIPLGRPMPTVLGYVLDKAGHRLPPGACGEYCLAGYQPARGYLGLPEKTAEVFGPLPEELNPTDLKDLRLYHTGDVVRYRENGDVEFVGRKDGMVKIRGFRIELKEVEAAIRPFEGVKDVTVQAYDYESGGKYLAAFVVPAAPDFDTKALLEYVRSQKPPYMVPSVVTLLERIPLTVNQKVDKKALPKPSLAAAAYLAPSSKLEEDFCAIFGEVLGVEKVSADSDFFEIGGSSIIALKVVIAAEKRGYAIVYNDVFSYPTPQAMAGHLGQGSAQADCASAHCQASVSVGEASPRDIVETAPDGFDYSDINALLRSGTLEAFLGGKRQSLGDVLLAGATGFLGIHVLKELICGHDGKIFCFIRSKEGETPEKRLRQLLKFYFDDDFAAVFGSRLFIVEGDATDPRALESFEPSSASFTVINCAACVKHFSKGDEIERINVGSVRNLVAWCLKHSVRLVHVSTGSVMGTYFSPNLPDGFKFDEHMLYVGQTVDDNQYVHSKFTAERIIYDAILHHGLNAKVLRAGNLAPRQSDGKFQINAASNNFMASLKAYRYLGMIPYSAMDSLVEFSPIDCTARAMLLLAETPRECVCFMPSNHHYPHLGDVVMQLGGVRMVEDEEFARAVADASSDPVAFEMMRPFMAYASGSAAKKPLGPDDLDVSYTVQVLYRLGFKWPVTGEEYVRKFISEL